MNNNFTDVRRKGLISENLQKIIIFWNFVDILKTEGIPAIKKS